MRLLLNKGLPDEVWGLGTIFKWSSPWTHCIIINAQHMHVEKGQAHEPHSLYIMKYSPWFRSQCRGSKSMIPEPYSWVLVASLLNAATTAWTISHGLFPALCMCNLQANFSHTLYLVHSALGFCAWVAIWNIWRNLFGTQTCVTRMAGVITCCTALALKNYTWDLVDGMWLRKKHREANVIERRIYCLYSQKGAC